MTRGNLYIAQRRRYPKKVRVLYGAAEALVDQRHLVKKYETNATIKYWSTWFLLKSLTSTSFIQDWTSHKKYILNYVQMGIKTFRKHLTWLQDNELLFFDAKNPDSIRLVSYMDAAEILKIEYDGTYEVSFNPKKIKNGKQPFQYLLRTEECETNKRQQIETIMYKLDNNPKLKQDIIYMIGQVGANYERLMNDDAYFVSRLLALQVKLFRDGSEILQYVMQCRADINRGVIRIKQHHRYRSKQSVSYMKRKMAKYGFITIEKRSIESKERSRLYVPPNEETPPHKIRNGLRDGYIWDDDRNITIWRLCDQISRRYTYSDNKAHQKINAYAA